MIFRKLLLIVLGLIFCLNSMASASAVTITLTSAALGIGPGKINSAKNGNAVEADRPGKLVTSLTANVGSTLYVQTDNLAGLGTALNPLLATITVRTHLDVQQNLPPGSDIHSGVITLTDGTKPLEKEGLGVRAFGIDLQPASPNFGKRYVNPAFLGTNTHGFQMEGSKEVSGGVDVTDFNDFVLGNPPVPGNNPPHVDEDVTFDINHTIVAVPADSVRVLLTKLKSGGGVFDLAVDLTINLVGGGSVFNSYSFLSDAPDVFGLLAGETAVIEVDFSAPSLGLLPTDRIDSFVIGARDDPVDPIKGTDEHFLINGFLANATIIPEPATLSLTMVLMSLIVCRRRKLRGSLL